MSEIMPIALGIFNADFSNRYGFFTIITTVSPFSDKIFAVVNSIPQLSSVANVTLSDNLNIFYIKISDLSIKYIKMGIKYFIKYYKIL